MKKKKKKKKNKTPTSLTLSMRAWTRLVAYQRLAEEDGCEVGMMGITRVDDPFYVEDLWLPHQETTSVHVEFDGADWDDSIQKLDDQGFPPERTTQVWIHTHPNMSPQPSGTDEDTYNRTFGGSPNAVMLIVNTDWDVYCIGRFEGEDVYLDVTLDGGIDLPTWGDEYTNRVFAGISSFSQENWDDDDIFWTKWDRERTDFRESFLADEEDPPSGELAVHLL